MNLLKKIVCLCIAWAFVTPLVFAQTFGALNLTSNGNGIFKVTFTPSSSANVSVMGNSLITLKAPMGWNLNPININSTNGGTWQFVNSKVNVGGDQYLSFGNVSTSSSSTLNAAEPIELFNFQSSNPCSEGGMSINFNPNLVITTNGQVADFSTALFLSNRPTANVVQNVTGRVGCQSCTPPAAPTLTASAGSISSGQSSTLSATGCAGTVTWSNGLGSGESKTVSPTSTTTYRVTCTIDGCVSPESNVTVNVSGGSGGGSTACLDLGDKCSGNSAEVRSYTLTAPADGNIALRLSYRAHEGNSSGRIRINGGDWKTFSLPIASTFQSLAIGTYTLKSGANTIEISSAGGFVCFRELCGEVATSPCVPPAAPSLSASASSITSGQSATLTATGCAGTVTWSNGLGTGSSKSVSPTATTTYTATCAVEGCTSAAGSVTVSVTAAPVEKTVCVALGDLCSGNSGELRTYSIAMVSAGNKSLQLTYRAHEKPSKGRIRINGGSWQTFDLPKTSASSYQTISIGTYALAVGSNTIDLSSGDGFVCFRELCAGAVTTTTARVGVSEEEITLPAALTIYPNPSSGEFQASFYVEQGRKAVLMATDMLGRQIYSRQFVGEGEHKETLRLDELKEGVYLLVLQKENGLGTAVLESKKIVIVK